MAYVFLSFRFDGTENPKSVSSSNYPHQCTSIGNYRNKAVVVGSFYPSNKITEVRNRKIWRKKTGDFPNVKTHISHYSMATVSDKLYLFGKWSWRLSTKISIFHQVFHFLPTFWFFRKHPTKKFFLPNFNIWQKIRF